MEQQSLLQAGISAWKTGNLGEARSIFSDLVEQAPDDPHDLEDILDETALRRFMDSLLDAVEAVNRSFEAAPAGDGDALECMGDALMVLGSRHMAAIFFTAALRKAPDDGCLRTKLGEMVLGGRLLHEAVAVFAGDGTIQLQPLVAS
jgi:tetratricopeptide (TPR) repeat protein